MKKLILICAALMFLSGIAVGLPAKQSKAQVFARSGKGHARNNHPRNRHRSRKIGKHHRAKRHQTI